MKYLLPLAFLLSCESITKEERMYHLDKDSGFIYYFENDSLHHVRADQFVIVPIDSVK